MTMIESQAVAETNAPAASPRADVSAIKTGEVFDAKALLARSGNSGRIGIVAGLEVGQGFLIKATKRSSTITAICMASKLGKILEGKKFATRTVADGRVAVIRTA